MASVKLRRLRSNEQIRDLFSQTRIKGSDLIITYHAKEAAKWLKD